MAYITTLIRLVKRLVAAVVLLSVLSATAAADFDDGEAAFARGNYVEAHREWLPLAVAGDSRAQWGVAHLYLLGLGVAQDVDLAAKWAKKSAEHGYVEGMSLLASLYQRGVGVPQDIQKAMEWRKKAAQTGDALAQYNLALVYLRGRNVPKDIEKALELLRVAADQNFQAAMFNLGVLYFKGTDVTQNFIRSYMWFELAASWTAGPSGDEPVGSMGNIRDKAGGIKKAVETHMTPADISKAQKLAREWKPNR